MHPCPGNRKAIGRAVVCYARAAHTFSVEIKCGHCVQSYDKPCGETPTGTEYNLKTIQNEVPL